METSLLIAPLFNVLNEIKPLSADLRAALVQVFQPAKIEKGGMLLREGNVSAHVCFLTEGLLRSYHNIGDKEITSRLMFSGHIVISAGSFFKQTPATESIEALSDCTIARLSFDALQHIYEKFPEFNYHTRLITEEYFHQQEQRLYMLRKQDALARYRYFLDNYSSHLKDIPGKYIATFLNITPETLSRTRARLGNK